MSSDEADTASSTHELSSALVSLLRLLANLCMEPTIGRLVGSRMEVLELLDDLLLCSQPFAFEELTLYIMAASTNISYYTCGVSL
jgi:hypothetical protein